MVLDASSPANALQVIEHLVCVSQGLGSRQGAVGVFLASYERDAIGLPARALSRHAPRHGAPPGVLFYLDNWRSQAPRDDNPLTGE